MIIWILIIFSKGIRSRALILNSWRCSHRKTRCRITRRGLVRINSVVMVVMFRFKGEDIHRGFLRPKEEVVLAKKALILDLKNKQMMKD